MDKKIQFGYTDAPPEMNLQKQEAISSLIYSASGSVKNKSVRLAFIEDPTINKDHYSGIYKRKRKLLPNEVIKQIRTNDHLIASILMARGNTLSMFGHLRKDRFDVGIDIKIKDEFSGTIDPDKMVQINERISQFKKILMNCGNTDGLDKTEQMLLSEFLYLQCKNALSFGQFATEIIYSDDHNEEFHRFRPVDAGTIYKSIRKGELAEDIRRTSLKMLAELTGDAVSTDTLEQGEYPWIQVVEGLPRQAFTSKELLMHNLFPSTDIEHNGYPLTPLDTIMNSVTTHMCIATYNKLYFQNGRAAKGMLIIKSDEVTQETLGAIKQQFMASINNVTNSFRTPIFGISKDDQIDWLNTDASRKDGEFQILMDQNAREILSAFGMSPDELSGYAHLSRGTNQQSLSESNNEYKLTAARDTGLRPLLLSFQEFFNTTLFPIIDEELANLCTINFAGLDADTVDKEAQKLQQSMPLYGSYNDIMKEVDKEPIGSHLAGDVPFNESLAVQQDKLIAANIRIGELTDNPAAYVDPLLQYRNDPQWLAYIQLLSSINPTAIQAMLATRRNRMEILKMVAQDFLDEDLNYFEHKTVDRTEE